MSEHAEKPDVSLKDKEDVQLKVSSAHAPDKSSELVVSNSDVADSTSSDFVPKESVPSDSVPNKNIPSMPASTNGGNEQKAVTQGLTIDERSSSGLRRHKIIVAACFCASLSLLLLNSFDLKHLIERSATLDKNSKLTFDTPNAELPPDLDYSEQGYRLAVAPELLPVYKSSWKGKLYGFVDRAGKLVIQPQFTQAFDFADGLAPVRVGDEQEGRWGYIDATGKFKVRPKFTFAHRFDHGVAVVRDGKRQALIDKTGEQIVPFDFFGFNFLNTGIVANTSKMRSGILDFSGKWILPPVYTDISEFRPTELTSPPSRVVPGMHEFQMDKNAKFLRIRKNDMYGVATSLGKVVVEPKYEDIISYNNGIVAISVDGKIGFVDDKTGKQLIPPQYDYATPYDSIIAVKKQGKWSFINSRGKPLSGNSFDKVITQPNGDWFSDGLGAVVVKDKVGYVNDKGEFVIKPLFDMATVFKNKRAIVYLANQFLTIDTSGKAIPGFVFGSLRGDYGNRLYVKIPGPLFPFVENSRIKDINRDIKDWIEGKSNFYYSGRSRWEY